MITKTTPSSDIEGIEWMKQLGFEAEHYDACRERVRVSTHSYSPTQSQESGKNDRLASVSKTERARKRYIVKPSLKNEQRETLPTDDPEISLSDLITRFRQLPKIDFAERIAIRLNYLLEVSREEQPEQAPPAAASLQGFLAFLFKNPDLAYPDLVLTPDGNVRAQWRRGPRQHFAVEFLEDEDVRFVIFAPDPKHPYKTARVSGTATVDSVMGQARYYQVLDWARAASESTAA